MRQQTPLTLDALNLLTQEDFTDTLGHLFESTPSIAAQTWAARPFPSIDQLHQALLRTMWALTPEQQVALIGAHPDLAGRAAIAGELTAESTREQASARLDRLTPEQYAEFHRLNDAYRAQFGFPFVICVREHTLTSILDTFRHRLTLTRDQEVATAMAEIGKIAGLRLRDAVA
jgi:OHCU decarboxylase